GVPSFAAKQQPSPFELVPGFNYAAGDSVGGPPCCQIRFSERAAVLADETCQRKVGQSPNARGPSRIVTDLRPGEERFEQVHVRIRFPVTGWLSTRPVGTVIGAQAGNNQLSQI